MVRQKKVRASTAFWSITHYRTVYFFLRDPSILNLDNIFGFILNVPNANKFIRYVPLPISSKHWIAIKKVDGGSVFYNLDSNLKAPQAIGEVSKLLELREPLRTAYINSHIKN